MDAMSCDEYYSYVYMYIQMKIWRKPLAFLWNSTPQKCWYTALTGDEPSGCSWQIYPVVNKINKVTTRNALAWYLWQKKHNHWRKTIVWVKKCRFVGRVRVFRQYKVYNIGWSLFTADISDSWLPFLRANSLRQIFYSTQPLAAKNKYIRLSLYLYLKKMM